MARKNGNKHRRKNANNDDVKTMSEKNSLKVAFLLYVLTKARKRIPFLSPTTGIKLGLENLYALAY